MAVTSKSETEGKTAEIAACLFLQKQGLALLEKNYRCRYGEIDLIMQDSAEVVFIEVRLRRQTYLGQAVETVDKKKQQKLIKTALLYLQKKRWLDTKHCRFDVLGMDSKNNIEWIKNAFSLDFF